MENDLNILEQAILDEIATYNEKQYPDIRGCLTHLKIRYRENTGVGIFLHFEQISEKDLIVPFNEANIVLSSDKYLELDTLDYGLNYELNITNGQIDFLELVTNGESWNGSFKEFRFLKL